MRFLVLILVTILELLLWTGGYVYGTLEGWGRKSLVAEQDAGAFMRAAIEEIDASYKGNAAFTLIENGRVHGSYFVSVGEPVDGDTLFQVASLSKWISAFGVMTLVEEGKIDLDAPVSTYLTRWSLPPSEFDNDGVTVRRLLSHMAGLGDGLGYGGFAPGEEVQPLTESLTQAADASPGADGAVKVASEPGSEWSYSGGGYTLLQLIVEEVSGMSFNDYMKAHVFEPLGMTRSTYILDEPAHENVAVLYGEDGAPAIHYRFTSLAATSLYTSANDLTRFIQAHVEGVNNEPIGRGVLAPETIAEMRNPHARLMGAAIWGLGTILYAPNNAGNFIAGHDGSNDPAINTAARYDPATRDGIVILETGNKLLATSLAGEWVFWRTGNVDFLDISAKTDAMFKTLAVGWAVILLGAVVVGLWLRRLG